MSLKHTRRQLAERRARNATALIRQLQAILTPERLDALDAVGSDDPHLLGLATDLRTLTGIPRHVSRETSVDS